MFSTCFYISILVDFVQALILPRGSDFMTNEVIFQDMLSSPAFTHRAILNTNHWKGKRWRSFCQQLSGVRPTEQQLHSCELQLESDLLLNGSEFKNKIMIFLYNSEMSKNTPPFFFTKVGCIMYSQSCWITKYPKILWLKTINYYVSWFL